MNNNNTNTVTFRRYPNRKLYDTSSRHYSNLGDVIQLIKEGKDVRVVDSVTNQDITKRILQSALFRVQKDQLFYKDVQDIHQMIREESALQG